MIQTSTFVQSIDGTRIHVQHIRGEGDGPTCLLIHGFGEGGYVWNETCRRLILETGVSIAVVDLRGHGESGWSSIKRYDLLVHVEDVLAVVSALSLSSLILIGHSLGGHVATHIAARNPGQVIGVMFVDICPKPKRDGGVHLLATLRENFRAYGSIEEYKQRLLEQRPLLSEEVARELACSSLRPSENGYFLKFDPALLEDSEDTEDYRRVLELENLLKMIRCPTTVLRGEGSAVVDASAALRMTFMLPEGRLLTIPSAGHSVMSDNPTLFHRALLRFIARVIEFNAIPNERLERAARELPEVP
jgi:pimeloyl-ACP methyl ester carboxylesterase